MRRGQFMHHEYDKKGTTIFEQNPGFYGDQPNADAVGSSASRTRTRIITAFTPASST